MFNDGIPSPKEGNSGKFWNEGEAKDGRECAWARWL